MAPLPSALAAGGVRAPAIGPMSAADKHYKQKRYRDCFTTLLKDYQHNG